MKIPPPFKLIICFLLAVAITRVSGCGKKHPKTPTLSASDQQFLDEQFKHWFGVQRIYKCADTGKYEVWIEDYSKKDEFGSIENARADVTNRASEMAYWELKTRNIITQTPCGERVQ